MAYLLGVFSLLVLSFHLRFLAVSDIKRGFGAWSLEWVRIYILHRLRFHVVYVSQFHEVLAVYCECTAQLSVHYSTSLQRTN